MTGAAEPMTVEVEARPAPPPPEPVPQTEPPSEEHAEVLPAPPRPGTVILHVGDSFVHAGLSQRLRELLGPLDVRYEVRAKASTTTLDWARRLPLEVAQTQPDLVIITLGANEIGSLYPQVQARAVRRIVEAMGSRPCVWTTPPLWLEESGFFDTLQANVSPCRFFETDRHVVTFLPRRDGVHPTLEAGAVWADGLFNYLMRERTGDELRPWQLTPSPDDEITLRGLRRPLPVTALLSDD